MSGGVGPTAGDIALPEVETNDDTSATISSCSSATPPRRKLLSFRQLNALAIALVLSFTGLVPLEDVAFSLFSLLYIYFLASFAFPTISPAPPPVFSPSNILLIAYVSLGAFLGLLLPIAYILHGVLEGDKQGIKAAAPHVFLLACQIFMEGLVFTRHFSLPMRAFVPVFYNGKRMLTIMEWVRNEVAKEEAEEHGSALRVHVGRGLALANMAFWGFNLFAFLLPVYLPRAFKRYYLKEKKEV